LYRHFKVARLSAKATRIITDLYTAFKGEGVEGFGFFDRGLPGGKLLFLLAQEK
jgi:hypothetical protein